MCTLSENRSSVRGFLVFFFIWPTTIRTVHHARTAQCLCVPHSFVASQCAKIDDNATRRLRHSKDNEDYEMCPKQRNSIEANSFFRCAVHVVASQNIVIIERSACCAHRSACDVRMCRIDQACPMRLSCDFFCVRKSEVTHIRHGRLR